MTDGPAEYLAPDADLAEAVRTRHDFFAHAPLGHRGRIRNEIKMIAASQRRHVSVSAAWGSYPEHHGGDYFYVLVG